MIRKIRKNANHANHMIRMIRVFVNYCESYDSHDSQNCESRESHDSQIYANIFIRSEYGFAANHMIRRALTITLNSLKADMAILKPWLFVMHTRFTIFGRFFQ